MAFQSVPNVYQVEIRNTWQGVDCENILHFRRSGVASQAQADALADAIANWWEVWITPLISNTVQNREVYVRDLESNPFIEGDSDIAEGITGQRTSTPEKNSVTKTVVFTSSVSGRSARGGNRIMGLTELQTDNNRLLNGEAASFLTAYSNLNAAVSGLNLSHCIVSRVTEHEKRTLGINYVVTGYKFPNLILGTTRSRIPTS